MRSCVTLFLLFFLSGCREAIKEEFQVSPLPDTSMVQREQTIPTPELETASKEENLTIQQTVERFLDDNLDANHSHEYRQAVGEVFLTQLNFCDGTGRPERTNVKTNKSANDETIVSYWSRGREDCGDEYHQAMSLRNGSVIALDWYMESGFDSCPCMSPVAPDCLDDQLLETISKISTLERVGLGGGFMTDSGLAKLAALTQLKSLQFSVETRNLYYLPENHLKLSYAAFDSLHGLANLEELVLSRHVHQIEADCTPLFRALPYYPKLRNFSAMGLTLNRENMEQLTSCGQLESLDIDGTMAEPCLDLLGKLQSLQTLRLNLHVNGHAVEIPSLPLLTNLHIMVSGAEGQCIEIRHFPLLTELSLAVSDAEKQSIVVSNHPSLIDLRLSLRTKENCVVLSDLPELTNIWFAQTNIRSIDVHFENLPKITVFRAQGGTLTRAKETWEEPFRFTQSILDAMLNLPALRSLSILGPLEENVDLNKLATLPSLSSLTLHGIDKFSPDLCSKLHVSDLTIHDCQLPDDFLLEDMPTVVNLDLSICSGKNITLKNAPLLKRFGFTGRWYLQESPPIFESLVFEGCPELTNVDYGGYIGNWNKVRLLDLRGTKVNKEDILFTIQHAKYRGEATGRTNETKILFE